MAGSAGTDPLQSWYRKQADTQRTLVRVSPRKAAGPDKIPGRVLRDCAGVRADVRAGIFNLSQQATVAKKPVVSCLSGYRPVALTPIVMKYFELLIKPHITASLPASFDQFACCPNRSIEDASLHPILGNSTKPSG